MPAVILLSIGGIIFLTAPSAAPGGMSAAPEKAAVNYQKFCAGCHGEKLEKFAAKVWMEEQGTASAVRSIKYGIESMGMPAFQKTFTDKEIEELAIYVKNGIPEDRALLKPAAGPGAVIESEVQRFVVDTVISGLNVPWGMAFFAQRGPVDFGAGRNTPPFFGRHTFGTYTRPASADGLRTGRVAGHCAAS